MKSSSSSKMFFFVKIFIKSLNRKIVTPLHHPTSSTKCYILRKIPIYATISAAVNSMGGHHTKATFVIYATKFAPLVAAHV